MLWIAVAAMCITMNQQPVPTTPTPSANRQIGAALMGLTPDAAAAAGLTPAQVGGLIDSWQQLDLMNRIASLTTNERNTSDSRARGDQSLGSFIALVTSARDQAISAAGITRECAANLTNCTNVVRAGLPAAWGSACPDAASQRAAAKALVAERRASRLGRIVPAEARGTLERIRAGAATIAAVERIRTNSTACRQAIGE